MSTLIVLLPPRDPAVPSQEWQLPELPFVLLDKAERTQRAGRSALALLPRANTTVLMVAARDLLLMPATLPPLRGPKLRQALPNIVEDQLIQDPQTCHIAVDPQGLGEGRHLLAIIDRGWFRFICEAFTAAGHRSLRAVPVTRCLPPAPVTEVAGNVDETAEVREPVMAGAASVATSPPGVAPVVAPEAPSIVPMVAAVLGAVVQTAPALLVEGAVDSGVPRVELAIARGVQGEGLAAPANAVNATLSALAGAAPVSLYMLTEVPGNEPNQPTTSPARLASHIHGASPLPFEQLARRALECRFDLCQFEFASQPWRLDRATLRRLRLPIVLAVAALVVAIIGANVQWLMLARQRDAINTQMTELLLNTFPKTTVVLDAPDQMARQLQQLRVAAGELSPEDFLSLADGLARSLSPLRGQRHRRARLSRAPPRRDLQTRDQGRPRLRQAPRAQRPDRRDRQQHRQVDHQERTMKAELAQTWAGFWDQRTDREKALLTWGGAALAVAIAWSVLWAPAQEGRAHLRQSLPSLQRQLAQMTAQANEARALSAAAQGVAPTGAALKDALSASLGEHGLAATQVQFVGNAVQVQMKNVAFPAWTAWVDDVRKQFKVQVSEAHITALKDDGQVDLTVALQPSSTK
ncbi:type II secretion system protein L [Paraburkholderia youngii]